MPQVACAKASAQSKQDLQAPLLLLCTAALAGPSASLLLLLLPAPSGRCCCRQRVCHQRRSASPILAAQPQQLLHQPTVGPVALLLKGEFFLWS